MLKLASPTKGCHAAKVLKNFLHETMDRFFLGKNYEWEKQVGPVIKMVTMGTNFNSLENISDVFYLEGLS